MWSIRYLISLFLLCSSFGFSKEGSVVLVHGFMRTSKNMEAIKRAIDEDYQLVLNWSYPSRDHYIEEHGESLALMLRQLAIKNPGESIHFVTHSMGALVVRSALNHEICPIEAKRGKAVLLAPPNNGSIFARKLYRLKWIRPLLGDKAGMQLMTLDSDEFDQFGQFPKEMDVLVISANGGFNFLIPEKNDGKVGFYESCLKTNHLHKTCFTCHSLISHTPSVIRTVRGFLSTRESCTT